MARLGHPFLDEADSLTAAFQVQCQILTGKHVNHQAAALSFVASGIIIFKKALPRPEASS